MFVNEFYSLMVFFSAKILKNAPLMFQGWNYYFKISNWNRHLICDFKLLPNPLLVHFQVAHYFYVQNGKLVSCKV